MVIQLCSDDQRLQALFALRAALWNRRSSITTRRLS